MQVNVILQAIALIYMLFHPTQAIKLDFHKYLQLKWSLSKHFMVLQNFMTLQKCSHNFFFVSKVVERSSAITRSHCYGEHAMLFDLLQ